MKTVTPPSDTYFREWQIGNVNTYKPIKEGPHVATDSVQKGPYVATDSVQEGSYVATDSVQVEPRPVVKRHWYSDPNLDYLELDNTSAYIFGDAIQKLLNREILTERLKAPVNNKLDSFIHLKKNWDSYNADKVSQQTIDFSKKVVATLIENDVPIDFCVPLRNGGVQLEFHDGTNEFELEIHPNRSIIYIKYDLEGNIVQKKKIKLGQINEIELPFGF